MASRVELDRKVGWICQVVVDAAEDDLLLGGKIGGATVSRGSVVAVFGLGARQCRVAAWLLFSDRGRDSVAWQRGCCSRIGVATMSRGSVVAGLAVAGGSWYSMMKLCHSGWCGRRHMSASTWGRLGDVGCGLDARLIGRLLAVSVWMMPKVVLWTSRALLAEVVSVDVKCCARFEVDVHVHQLVDGDVDSGRIVHDDA